MCWVYLNIYAFSCLKYLYNWLFTPLWYIFFKCFFKWYLDLCLEYFYSIFPVGPLISPKLLSSGYWSLSQSVIPEPNWTDLYIEAIIVKGMRHFNKRVKRSMVKVTGKFQRKQWKKSSFLLVPLVFISFTWFYWKYTDGQVWKAT